jgi:hypothetical protein
MEMLGKYTEPHDTRKSYIYISDYSAVQQLPMFTAEDMQRIRHR